MSNRLQVLLDPKEYKLFQKMARQEGLSLGEWVRKVLRKAQEQLSQQFPSQKLKALQKAAQHQYPSADIDQMLSEIEKGYLKQ